MGRRRREIRGRTRNKYKKQKGVLSFARFFFFLDGVMKYRKVYYLSGLNGYSFFPFLIRHSGVGFFRLTSASGSTVWEGWLWSVYRQV